MQLSYFDTSSYEKLESILGDFRARCDTLSQSVQMLVNLLVEGSNFMKISEAKRRHYF